MIARAVRRHAIVLALLAGCTRSDPGTTAWRDALRAERAAKDAYVAGADGPLAPEHRATFHGLRYYEPDASWRVRGVLEAAAAPDTVRFLTSQRSVDLFLRVGRVRFTHGGQSFALSVYRPPADERLFLPFTDATTGGETYGAGRYLDPEPIGTDTLGLDFNRAYNPYCAYDAKWVCPVAPPENHLDVPVRAGEKSFGHGSE